jgi:hypothetical protein
MVSLTNLNRNARLRFGEEVYKFGTFDFWKSVCLFALILLEVDISSSARLFIASNTIEQGILS